MTAKVRKDLLLYFRDLSARMKGLGIMKQTEGVVLKPGTNLRLPYSVQRVRVSMCLCLCLCVCVSMCPANTYNHTTTTTYSALCYTMSRKQKHNHVAQLKRHSGDINGLHMTLASDMMPTKNILHMSLLQENAGMLLQLLFPVLVLWEGGAAAGFNLSSVY